MVHLEQAQPEQLQELLQDGPVFFFINLCYSACDCFRGKLFHPECLNDFHASPLVEAVFVADKGTAEACCIDKAFFLQMFQYVGGSFRGSSPLLQFGFNFGRTALCCQTIDFCFVSEFVFGIFFHGLTAFTMRSLPERSLRNSTE